MQTPDAKSNSTQVLDQAKAVLSATTSPGLDIDEADTAALKEAVESTKRTVASQKMILNKKKKELAQVQEELQLAKEELKKANEENARLRGGLENAESTIRALRKTEKTTELKLKSLEEVK